MRMYKYTIDVYKANKHKRMNANNKRILATRISKEVDECKIVVTCNDNYNVFVKGCGLSVDEFGCDLNRFIK